MIEISISDICQKIQVGDRILVTRQLGEQVFEQITDLIKQDSLSQAIILVFPKEQLIDPSFADETILRLQKQFIGAADGKGTIIVRGLTQDSIHNLNAAIKYQNLKIPLLSMTSEKEWDIVGSLEQSLRETLDLVAKHARLTAPELAQILSLAINTASNRLKRLYDLRLVRREFEITDNGLQYIYYFWLS